MENKKKLTAEELSVLMWLKVLDDFEAMDEFGNPIIALEEKLECLDVKSLGIDTEFFYSIVEKLEDLGLVTKTSVSKQGRQIAGVLLKMENAKIAVTTSMQDIYEFVKANRTDIISAMGVAVSVVELIL